MKDRETSIQEEISSSISKKNKYKGYLLEEALISHIYLKKTNLFKTTTWKSFIKAIIGFAKNNIFRLSPKAKLFIKHKTDNLKIAIALNFEIEDVRHSAILIDLIQGFYAKKDLLIYTNKQSVVKFCDENNLSCINIQIPKYRYRLKDLSLGYTFNESVILEEYRCYINLLQHSFMKFSPKLVITTQDFLIPDLFYAKIAKSNGIITITHQHGEIPSSEKSMFSFMFSDFIFCWGEISKNRLKKSINESKIVIVGTSKFKEINSTQKSGKDNILLTTSVFSLDELKLILNDVLIQIGHLNNITIKIHPSQDQNKVEKIVSSISQSLKINQPRVIKKSIKLSKLLEDTCVMINIGSGVYLEALISSTSVIELKNKSINPLIQIPESLLSIGELRKEVINRLSNVDYNRNIIQKQNLLLSKYIHSSNLDDEYKFIENILNKESMDIKSGQ